MKIGIASDHAGYHLKRYLISHLSDAGHQVVDYGTDSDEPVDYPDYIRPAAQQAAAGNVDCAIVLGGSGNGEAIVANKVRGIRCALCWDETSGRLAKEHNNANAIAMGERMVSPELGAKIVDTWLAASFEGGRHQRRIDKIEAD